MLRSRHVQRTLEDLRPYLAPLIVLLLVSLLAIPITLIVPLPIKILVDSVLGSQSLPRYLTIVVGSQVSKGFAIWLAISMLLGTAVLTWLLNLVNVWYSSKVGNRMTLDVRARLFRQMQRLSIAYHDTMGAADSAYRTLRNR
ncbi:ABC transporter ATP-binding protein [Candidatus Bathyarchaeota archaeon]|nr:MAG: ABC transporter ATP-binding protein [Candidatus Bathyarchaeota archaeon]